MTVKELPELECYGCGLKGNAKVFGGGWSYTCPNCGHVDHDKVRPVAFRERDANPTEYTVQSARDAQAAGYGDWGYWDYLEVSAKETHDYYLARGDKAQAEHMLTRTLTEALRGNDGE